MEYRSMSTLGFTHLQPAQLTTVGKRFSLYLQDFYIDYLQLIALLKNWPMRGVKGTTGTQASFLDLFDNDHSKVKLLEKRVCEMMGFDNVLQLTGQTYTRKLDYSFLTVLSGIAQSSHKMCTDIRLFKQKYTCHIFYV